MLNTVKIKRASRRSRTISTLVLSALLCSGCSIAERTSVELVPLHSPAGAVMLDVYDRSVDSEVYSSPKIETLEEEETLKPADDWDTLKRVR